MAILGAPSQDASATDRTCSASISRRSLARAPLQDSSHTFQGKPAFLGRMSSQCWQLPEAGRGPADTRVHPSDFIEGEQTVLVILHKLSDIAEGTLPVVQT